MENEQNNYKIINNLKLQLEWTKRQLEYALFQGKYNPKFDLKAGEIYEFDFGVNVNCELSNRHYGVVLADSHASNPIVMVCPLKTNKYGPHPYSDINLGFIDGIVTEHETLAVINQIRSLDKMRIYVNPIINEQFNGNQKIKLNSNQMRLLKTGIKNMLI